MATCKTIACMTALLFMAGCSTTPRFDKSFGASVRANLAAQTIAPQNGANANPAHGIDGAAARAAQTRYQRSFAQPEPEPMPVIRIMGSGQ